MRKKISGIFAAAVFLPVLVLMPLCAHAGVPAPYLRLSFDQGFRMDGAAAGKLKNFSKSLFPGIENVPAGEFVAGISGQAFIPTENLIIKGEGIFPAPEGTISLWIKPVRYKEDWAGGPMLTSGRIGAFLTGTMKDKDGAAPCSLQVRLYQYDYCSGLYWVEYWTWPAQQFSTTGPQAPFSIWQEGKWRMLTVVWSQGERRIYFDGVCIQHGTSGPGKMDYIAASDDYTVSGTSTTEVSRNPTMPGDSLCIPAGSKAVDELMVWNTPLIDAQVAALFFAKIPQSGLTGAVQSVPQLMSVPDIGKDVDKTWAGSLRTGGWQDSFSGMVSEAKDALELGQRDGWLFIRYREPMPKDYIAIKTLLGGNMLKRSVTGRDGNVWADDCVEVRLTGDRGQTNYVFAVSASGALYDARNGDAGFNVSANDWIVYQDAGEKFWTVEMRLNLAALSGGQAPPELGFNLVRTVRQQGFAVRQWSFAAGDANVYGRLSLDQKKTPPVTAEMDWSEATGKLSVSVRGRAETPLTVSYSIVPLGHVDILPDEKEINTMIRAGGKDKTPAAVKSEERLLPGEVDWQGKLDYSGETAALASLVVKDDAGATLSSRSFLISGSELVSTRISNLPSRREMVVRIFLASETLAGSDVTADISVAPAGKTEPVLREKVIGFGGIMKEAAVDVSGVKPGSYTVEAVVYKKGKLLGKKKSNWFKSGDPEWLGNDIGIIKSVPAPWTPVKKTGGSIEVWGRTHSFAGSLLPAAMRVLDEDILSGPMRLVIKTADETIDTARTSTPVMAVDGAGIGATLAGKVQGKNLIVEMNGALEFDGFASFKFTLRPVDKKRPVSIKSIVFEVPFKKKYAELYDDSNYNLFGAQSGRIPAEGMELVGTGTVRVGDAARGVQFWPLFVPLGTRAAVKPLTFTPTADSMVMRYVISEGVTLDGPLTDEIGIIGTPLKPYDAKRVRLTCHAGLGVPSMPSDLREKGYSAADYWFSSWTDFNGGSGQESGYFNYSPEWCAGFAKSLKKGWVENRRYYLLKVQPGLITARSPEYAYFFQEWGGQYDDWLEKYALDLSGYRGADVRPPGDWTMVDWTSRSYQDFYFYGLDKVLSALAREGVRTGFYVDCTDHRADMAHVKGYRQWMQRLYQVARKYSPDGLIVVHMSGDRRMAVWGMADMLAEGEQYTANWSAYMANKPELTFNDCFPTALPLDRVRATYSESLWGAQPVFLSQLWSDARQKEDVYSKENGGRPAPSYFKRQRYITGLMLVHDTPFWGEFYACGVKDDPWIKRARWGYDQTVQFIPYWDNRGMLKIESPDNKDIVVSGWLRPDGNLMAEIFNDTNDAVQVRLRVNPEKFPVQLKNFTRAVDITSPVAAFNPEATKPDVYEYKEGILKVDMRPRDFRLLILE